MAKTTVEKTMISTTGKNQTGFTLLELAVVVAIIFILASSLIVIIPMIEARTAKARAKADIMKLDLALGIYKEAERSLPPDRFALLNISGSETTLFGNPAPSAAEQSNIYMVHYLTTQRSRDGYLELEESEATQLSGTTMTQNVGDSMLIPSGTTANFPAYMLLDPWGNPYVYDNNQGDPDGPTDIDAFNGQPNHNPDFDLYSLGPDGQTAEDNGVDDDGDDPDPPNTLTDASQDPDEILYNGRERKANGDLGDDINNFKTEK